MTTFDMDTQISNQLNFIATQIQTMLGTDGDCEVVDNEEMMWKQAMQSSQKLMVFVTWTGDTAWGGFSTAGVTHRVTRQWVVTAWGSDGATNAVTVNIPGISNITVTAIPSANVYQVFASGTNVLQVMLDEYTNPICEYAWRGTYWDDLSQPRARVHF